MQISQPGWRHSGTKQAGWLAAWWKVFRAQVTHVNHCWLGLCSHYCCGTCIFILFNSISCHGAFSILTNSMSLTRTACSSHAQMTRLPLACNLQINASPRYLRTSEHWDGKNGLPIAFRSAVDMEDGTCVCLCTTQRRSALIAQHAHADAWGHPQSSWLGSSFTGARSSFLFTDTIPDVYKKSCVTSVIHTGWTRLLLLKSLQFKLV